MRLWSLHPHYLDAKGLVALWREALLAQAVLVGKTKGYKHHPQLTRFLQTSAPEVYLATYLQAVHREAICRGYRFDYKKIGRCLSVASLPVARGQLEYEWQHLTAKLRNRAPLWLEKLGVTHEPTPHPLFHITEGGIAAWEVISARALPQNKRLPKD